MSRKDLALAQRRPRFASAYLEHEQDAEEYQGQSSPKPRSRRSGNTRRPAPIIGCWRAAVGVRASRRSFLTANPGGAGHGWCDAAIDSAVRSARRWYERRAERRSTTRTQ